MNSSNVIIIISTLIIAVIFFGGVFLNLETKKSKEELNGLYKEIDELKLEIKRQDIEISTLTSPINVLNFIEKNNYRPITLKNIETLYIKKD